MEMIHQPPRADEAEPHAAWRLIPAVENVLKRGYPLALVADADFERLHRRARVDEELGPATARIAEGVTGQFGHRSRDPHRDNRPGFAVCRHRGHHLPTSTVASSRPRLKSR